MPTADLDRWVAEYVSFGCQRRDRSLGFQKMPDGYALMLDADFMYYFWLCADGRSSDICWNPWWVRRGALADQAGTQ